jgi:MFS family permease
MSGVAEEQPSAAPSRVQALRAQVRGWFRSTGAPPAWALVRSLACGLAAGIVLSAALPHFRATILSALAGGIVAAAGSGGPSGISRRLALITAGWGFLLTVVGFATGGHPVWAALAMAAVALLTSIAAAAGPLGGIVGFLLSLAYMLVATLSRVSNIQESVSLHWAVAHIAVGCIGGLVVVFVGTAWRRRQEPDEVRTARAPLPLRPIWESLRSFDEHARDGVRRAIPLAVLMFFFQLDGGRDAFWTFFAAYLVLLTPGKAPKSLALARVGSTLFGVVLLAVISLAVPDRVLFSFGMVILLSGVGLSPPYPVIAGGPPRSARSLMAGAPAGAVGNWAERRLLDTLLGCAVALVATYLLWPRDSETEEVVPAPT